MKHPVGTKCWVIWALKDCHIGEVVTIVSHDPDEDSADYGPCARCGSLADNDVLLDDDTFCCCCSLIPIDDPDAGKAVEEDLALPIDPRKIGEPA